MAYNTEHITKLGHLKDLAEKIKQDYATKEALSQLQEKVEGLENEGGQPNVIETVKVNGEALEVEDKTVDITVPTKVSELDNDETYQTEDEVQETVDKAVSEAGHASMKVVDEVPAPEDAESNVLYLVKNEETGYYDVYALIGDEVVRIDDTSIDLTDYVTTEALAEAIADFITLKSLSATEDGEGNVVTSVSYDNETGEFKVTKDATAILDSDIATDEEVAEMLEEVFGEDDGDGN